MLLEQLSRKKYLRTRVSPDKNKDKSMNLKQRTITACIKKVFVCIHNFNENNLKKKKTLENNKTNYKNVLKFWCVK